MAKAKLTGAELDHLSQLANLPLSPAEKKKFSSQLIQILDYVAQLQKLDTANVSETAQVTGLENVTRKDKTGKTLAHKQALSQAPNTHEGYFKVPAIFGSDES